MSDGPPDTLTIYFYPGLGWGTTRIGLPDEGVVETQYKKVPPPTMHYPPGMGEESRRLHREYNVLVRAQRAGAKNGAEVVKLTDECSDKGIILVPGGEHL